VALDTYPYHGTTTTCEALWMGVPVITLAGATHVSRVGASIMKRVGLEELVASDHAQYVDKALALSADLQRLAALRHGMRERMRTSPLMDAAGFARAMESAYLDAWRRWLESGKVGDLAAQTEPLRLHIGGKQWKEGWRILNIQPGEDVDFVGDCCDLGQFADGSVHEVYASHVLEHLGYQTDLPRALSEIARVLKPGGSAMISVPDFEVLCRQFLDPGATPAERFHTMRMAFGGQIDKHDFHFVGLSDELLRSYLYRAGFARVERVKSFDLFRDASVLEVGGRAISLNVIAYK
jgi:predicted SAM-dependent methyltransferase